MVGYARNVRFSENLTYILSLRLYDKTFRVCFRKRKLIPQSGVESPESVRQQRKTNKYCVAESLHSATCNCIIVICDRVQRPCRTFKTHILLFSDRLSALYTKQLLLMHMLSTPESRQHAVSIWATKLSGISISTRCASWTTFRIFCFIQSYMCHSEPATGGAKNLIPKSLDILNRWVGDSSLRSE